MVPQEKMDDYDTILEVIGLGLEVFNEPNLPKWGKVLHSYSDRVDLEPKNRKDRLNLSINL